MSVSEHPSVPGYWYPAPVTPERAASGPEAEPSADSAALSHTPEALVEATENADAARASAVAVLHAVRRFRRSDTAMRTRTAAELCVNATDLAALRHLVASGRRGEPVGPTELSVYLSISSAATTKLLNRLALLGHIRREPHPTDRRAQLIVATDDAHTAIHQALGDSHQRMMAVVTSFSAEEQRTLTRFLDALSGAVTDSPDT